MPSCCEPTISLPWMVSPRGADVEPATWMPSKTAFSISLSMKVVESPSNDAPTIAPGRTMLLAIVSGASG